MREVEYTDWIYIVIYTWKKGLEIYSANLGTNVEGLAHLSLLFLIMCDETTTLHVHHAFLYIS